jgi:predicted ATP-grasp superfamily ATP-dependent carboligase
LPVADEAKSVPATKTPYTEDLGTFCVPAACGRQTATYDGGMREPLLIVGASARAAAQSANRAGFAPLCVDLFADADLCASAKVVLARPFPEQVPEIVAQLPAAPLLLTGAMENHLEIVKCLSKQRILYGNPPQVLEAVRNPLRLAEVLRDHRLSTPEVHLDAKSLEPEKSWLMKPRLGSAGRGIQIYDPHAVPDDVGDDVYYQEYLAGHSVSAVFNAAQNRVKLMGVTRQLIGTPWLHVPPFAYAGSIGPLALDSKSYEHWMRIGTVLSRTFGLRGLFGVDAILNRNDIFPVEVNPRFTASVEILERAFSVQTILEHVLACRDGHLDTQHRFYTKGRYGKAILYAPQDITVSREILALTEELNDRDRWPVLADIPRPGTSIRQGKAILTLLVAVDRKSSVAVRLRQLAITVSNALQIHSKKALHSPCVEC